MNCEEMQKAINEMKETTLVLKTCQQNIKQNLEKANSKYDKIWWTILGLGIASMAERYFLGG